MQLQQKLFKKNRQNVVFRQRKLRNFNMKIGKILFMQLQLNFGQCRFPIIIYIDYTY